MDKSKAEKWVNKNLPKFARVCGVSHWRIWTYFEPIEGSAAMRVTMQQEYETAQIKINYPIIDDETQLEGYLVHELLHLALSPYELLMDVIRPHLEGAQLASFEELERQVCEMAVRNLERAHKGHKDYYG